MNWLISYVREARAELTKVTWPTRQQAVRLSIAVIVFSVAFAALIAALDYVFSLVLQKLILKG
jgi:preprotein translocase subunit SecE